MSETKNLKLKKHDNVATNTNAFDIENHLNKNWDILDLEDEVVNEKIEVLEEKADNIQPKNIEGHDDIINILDLKNAAPEVGMYPNATTYVTRKGFTTTDYIRVKEGDKIFLNFLNPMNVCSAVCFDKNKTIIDKLITSADWVIYGAYTVPANVEFMKFTIQTSQIASYGVYLGATEAPSKYKSFNESALSWLRIRENNLDEDVKKIISDLQEENRTVKSQLLNLENSLREAGVL